MKHRENKAVNLNTMPKPDSTKVTVVIPTFNASAYIGQALASVIQQTEQNLEIIVCDDLSTDNTLSVIEAMMQQDSRIRLLKNQQNFGPSYCRNLAISIAQGEWIALLDADDFYHPDRLRTLINIAEVQHADMVADNIVYVDSNGQNPTPALVESTSNSTITTLEFIANDLPISTGFNYGYLKPIIRRAFLEQHQIRYEEQIRLGEDFMFCVECLIQGAVFILTHQPYYHYRIVAKSLSRTGDNSGYQQLNENNSKLINLAIKAGESAVIRMLKKRQKRFNQLIIYYDIVRLIKGLLFYSAIKKLLVNPAAWPICFILGSRYLKKRLYKS